VTSRARDMKREASDSILKHFQAALTPGRRGLSDLEA
jgi:hypothetical protein